MATATKTRRRPAPAAVLELPVTYGNVSFGDKTARIGVTVHRGNLTVTEADRHLVGRRLTCTILARANGHSDQDSLPGLEAADPELTNVADVKSIGVSGKVISFGLTYALDGLDIETLAHFAKREGVLTVTGTAAIPDDEQDDDE